MVKLFSSFHFIQQALHSWLISSSVLDKLLYYEMKRRLDWDVEIFLTVLSWLCCQPTNTSRIGWYLGWERDFGHKAALSMAKCQGNPVFSLVNWYLYCVLIGQRSSYWLLIGQVPWRNKSSEHNTARFEVVGTNENQDWLLTQNISIIHLTNQPVSVWEHRPSRAHQSLLFLQSVFREDDLIQVQMRKEEPGAHTPTHCSQQLSCWPGSYDWALPLYCHPLTRLLYCRHQSPWGQCSVSDYLCGV